MDKTSINNTNSNECDFPVHLRFPVLQHDDDFFKYIKKCNMYAVRNLGRKMVKNEIVVFQDFYMEYYMDRELAVLHKKCQEKNLCVPQLTTLVGDCLFESCVYHKLAINVQNLRYGISYMMYIFKDCKDFFGNGDTRTLNDIFNDTNEIEYVKRINKNIDAKQNDIKKYNYDAMCQDICNMTSWSKLPTELILMMISFLYKVNIIIIKSNSEWVKTINMYEHNPNFTNHDKIKTIHLGHIGESHYVPIDFASQNEQDQNQEQQNCLFYTESYAKCCKLIKEYESFAYKSFMHANKRNKNKHNNRSYVNLNKENRDDRNEIA